MVFGICERVEGRAYVIVVCVCAIEGGGGGWIRGWGAVCSFGNMGNLFTLKWKNALKIRIVDYSA